MMEHGTNDLIAFFEAIFVFTCNKKSIIGGLRSKSPLHTTYRSELAGLEENGLMIEICSKCWYKMYMRDAENQVFKSNNLQTKLPPYRIN